MHYFQLHLLFHAVHLDLLYEDSIIHVYEKFPLVLMHCWNQEGNFHFPACFRCVNIENKCYFWLRWEKDLEECHYLPFWWRVELAVLRIVLRVCYTQKAITVELSSWPVSSSLCFLLHFLHLLKYYCLLLINYKRFSLVSFIVIPLIVRYLSRHYVQCNLRHCKV